MSVWDQDRVAKLKAYYAQDLSASVIAQQLGGGITRNSVIGKLHRLGLLLKASPETRRLNALRSTAARKRKAGWNPSRGGRTQAQMADDRARAKAQFEAIMASKAEPEINIPPHERKTLLIRDEHGRLHANESFTHRDCHWIVAESGGAGLAEYCGRPAVAGLAYCADHATRLGQVRLPARPALAVSENVGEKEDAGGVRVSEEA